MFFRLFGYSVKRSLRQKDIIFWSLVFPIILGTLFKVSFGGYHDTLQFEQIDIACVTGEGSQEEFTELLHQLETESELVKVVYTTGKEAEKLLEKDKIMGIYYNEAEIFLKVSEEGIRQSILKSILEQYNRSAAAFADIMTAHPEGMTQAVQALEGEWNYLKEDGITNKKMDVMTDYFYALIAMSCLFGCFMGSKCAIGFKADLSALAARRTVASTNRFLILCADVAAKVLVQFCCTVIGVIYLRYALKVELGTETLRILLVILLGSLVGVLTGVFIASVGKGKASLKDGICTGFTMLECFLAGLMVAGMYRMVEAYAPVINRINPAALMLKAMNSLNIYENYTRYNQCVLGLVMISAVLGIGSYLLVRRERYASI